MKNIFQSSCASGIVFLLLFIGFLIDYDYINVGDISDDTAGMMYEYTPYRPRPTPGNPNDSKVHGANTGPTWVLSAPGGPHVGHVNLAILAILLEKISRHMHWCVNA